MADKLRGGSTIGGYVALHAGNIQPLLTGAGMVKSDTTGITGATAITNIVAMTQAAYDLITPDASTFYVIVG